MPDETPTPEAPSKAEQLKEQARLAAEAKQAALEKQKAILKAYQENVGKTFTFGDSSVVLKQFIPSMNVKGKDGPAFLVSKDHTLVNRFVNCEDFLATYTLKQ